MSIFNLATEICLLVGFVISLGLLIHAYRNKLLVWWYQRRNRQTYLPADIAGWLIGWDEDSLDRDWFGRERFSKREIDGQAMYSFDDLMDWLDTISTESQGVAVSEKYAIRMTFIPKKFGSGQ